MVIDILDKDYAQINLKIIALVTYNSLVASNEYVMGNAPLVIKKSESNKVRFRTMLTKAIGSKGIADTKKQPRWQTSVQLDNMLPRSWKLVNATEEKTYQQKYSKGGDSPMVMV